MRFVTYAAAAAVFAVSAPALATTVFTGTVAADVTTPTLSFGLSYPQNFDSGTYLVDFELSAPHDVTFEVSVTNRLTSYWDGAYAGQIDDIRSTRQQLNDTSYGSIVFRAPEGFSRAYTGLHSSLSSAPFMNPIILSFSKNAGEVVDYRITLNRIGGVPEPSTWAMLIAGFGMVGAAVRVRARKPENAIS